MDTSESIRPLLKQEEIKTGELPLALRQTSPDGNDSAGTDSSELLDARQCRAIDRHLEACRCSSLPDLTVLQPYASVNIERRLRLILLGGTGSGKTSTGNTLMGRTAVNCSERPKETYHDQLDRVELDGQTLEVLDTAAPWQMPKSVHCMTDNELFVLVVDMTNSRFDFRQLRKIQKMKDSRNRSVLGNKLCFLVLTHAREGLQNLNLTEWVQERRGSALEQLITKDLATWRVIAVENYPDTEYEQHQQANNLQQLIQTVNAVAMRQMPGLITRMRIVRTVVPLVITIVIIVVIVVIIVHSV